MATTDTAFSIRPVEDEELDAWLALRNVAFPWPVDRARFLFEESLRPPAEPVVQLGAWCDDGHLVGTAECYLGEEGERYVDRAESYIMVAPSHRRRGLGTRLAEEVEGFATGRRLRWLEALFYQRVAPQAQPFLEHRGFKELERYRDSWQEPSKVSLDGLEGLRAGLRQGGIQTAPFAEVDSEMMRRTLYRCAMAIQRDMPHADHADWHDAPYESWIRKALESPGSLPDTMFIARDGDEIVGLTYLVARPDGDAEVGDTGVLRSHRRRGIARVLKMMATQYAARRGIRRVQTDNRTDNVGMLAINRELGFKPGELILIFEKTLRS